VPKFNSYDTDNRTAPIGAKTAGQGTGPAAEPVASSDGAARETSAATDSSLPCRVTVPTEVWSSSVGWEGAHAALIQDCVTLDDLFAYLPVPSGTDCLSEQCERLVAMRATSDRKSVHGMMAWIGLWAVRHLPKRETGEPKPTWSDVCPAVNMSWGPPLWIVLKAGGALIPKLKRGRAPIDERALWRQIPMDTLDQPSMQEATRSLCEKVKALNGPAGSTGSNAHRSHDWKAVLPEGSVANVMSAVPDINQSHDFASFSKACHAGAARELAKMVPYQELVTAHLLRLGWVLLRIEPSHGDRRQWQVKMGRRMGVSDRQIRTYLSAARAVGEAEAASWDRRILRGRIDELAERARWYRDTGSWEIDRGELPDSNGRGAPKKARSDGKKKRARVVGDVVPLRCGRWGFAPPWVEPAHLVEYARSDLEDLGDLIPRLTSPQALADVEFKLHALRAAAQVRFQEIGSWARAPSEAYRPEDDCTQGGAAPVAFWARRPAGWARDVAPTLTCDGNVVVFVPETGQVD
jgi:hypothetical protein